MSEPTFTLIRCPHCRTFFKPKDRVVLDLMNGLSHSQCFAKNKFTMKDSGTYREIFNKYDFFHESV